LSEAVVIFLGNRWLGQLQRQLGRLLDLVGRQIGQQPLDQTAALIERQLGDQSLSLLEQRQRRRRLLGGGLLPFPSVRACTLGTLPFLVKAETAVHAAEPLDGAAGA